MVNGKWSLYDRPAGDQYPGKSICDFLAAAFWETLFSGVALVLTMEVHGEAVGVAVGGGKAVRRDFFGGDAR